MRCICQGVAFARDLGYIFHENPPHHQIDGDERDAGHCSWIHWSSGCPVHRPTAWCKQRTRCELKISALALKIRRASKGKLRDVDLPLRISRCAIWYVRLRIAVGEKLFQGLWRSLELIRRLQATANENCALIHMVFFVSSMRLLWHFLLELCNASFLVPT